MDYTSRKRSRSASAAALHNALIGGLENGNVQDVISAENRARFLDRLHETVKLLNTIPPTISQQHVVDRSYAQVDAAANLLHVQQASLSAAIHARRMRRRLLTALAAVSPVAPPSGGQSAIKTTLVLKIEIDAAAQEYMRRKCAVWNAETGSEVTQGSFVMSVLCMDTLIVETLSGMRSSEDVKAACCARVQAYTSLGGPARTSDNTSEISQTVDDMITSLIETGFIKQHVDAEGQSHIFVGQHQNAARFHDGFRRQFDGILSRLPHISHKNTDLSYAHHTVRDFITPSAESLSASQFCSNFAVHLPISKELSDGSRKTLESFASLLPNNFKTASYNTSVTDAGALCTPALALVSLRRPLQATLEAEAAPNCKFGTGNSNRSAYMIASASTTPELSVKADVQQAVEAAVVPVVNAEQLAAAGKDSEVVSAPHHSYDNTTLTAATCTTTVQSEDVSSSGDSALQQPAESTCALAVNPALSSMPSAFPATQQVSNVITTATADVFEMRQEPSKILSAMSGKKRGRAATVTFDVDGPTGARRSGARQSTFSSDRIKRLRVAYDGGWCGANVPLSMLVSAEGEVASMRLAPLKDSAALCSIALNPRADAALCVGDHSRTYERFGLVPDLQAHRRGGDGGPLEDGSLRLSSFSHSFVGNGLSFVGAFMGRESLYTCPTAALDAPVEVNTTPLTWALDIAPKFEALCATDPQLVDATGSLCGDAATADAATARSTTPPSRSVQRSTSSFNMGTPDSSDDKGRHAMKLDEDFHHLDGPSTVAVAVPIPVTVKTSAGSAATVPGVLKLQPYDPYTSQNPIVAGTRITPIARPVSNQGPAVLDVTEALPLLIERQASPVSTAKLDVFTPVYRELPDREVYGDARIGVFSQSELKVLAQRKEWGHKDLSTGKWIRPTSSWDVHAPRFGNTANVAADAGASKVCPFPHDIEAEDGIADPEELLLDNAGYDELHKKADAVIRALVAESMKRIQAARDKLGPQSPGGDKDKSKSKNKRRAVSPPSSPLVPLASSPTPTQSDSPPSTPSSDTDCDTEMIQTKPVAQVPLADGRTSMQGPPSLRSSLGPGSLNHANGIAESSAFQRPLSPKDSRMLKAAPQEEGFGNAGGDIPGDSPRGRVRSTRQSERLNR